MVPAPTVKVMIEEPLMVTVVGAKPEVTPDGRPLTLNPTVPLNPPVADTLTV